MDTRILYRPVIGLWLLAGLAAGTGAAPVAVLPDARAGGEATVHTTSQDAFARPLPSLPPEQLRAFAFGNKIFNTNWVIAPASVTSLDGLGPTFNRVSCSGCHFKDGRGRPPLNDSEPMNSMLMRLSLPGRDRKTGGVIPHPAYGDQLNDKAIPGVPAEGRAVVRYEEQPGQYPDGRAYSLRRPVYEFVDMVFGPLDGALFSPRVAPAVFGLGLLEAIPDETLLAWAKENRQRKDGIRGRPNRVWDSEQQKTAIGRFGWKANVATLNQQNAGAAHGDIGLTSSLHPQQNCPPLQTACQAAPDGGQPELTDRQLERLTFYTQTLAVPARRNPDDTQVQQGAALFTQLQCAVCHRPSVSTGPHAIPSLSHQTIQPFTDLLLHDMGDALADGRPDFQANGREWRTPPLWGIGLVQTVNRHSFFLHDGRARNLEEAILWHGGEAEASQQAFQQLTKDEREAVLVFLESL